MKNIITVYLIVFCCFRFMNAEKNNTELAFLLGVSDFSKIVETTVFIDKTLFVKKVFLYDFILITAPNKFGKSTNMDMLKTFLEIVVEEDGHPIINVEEDRAGKLVEKSQEKLTTNFNLFKKHNLSVYQDKQFFYKHCGQVPVMFINFKEVGGDTFAEVLDSLKTAIHNTFKQHDYLLNCTELWSTNNANGPEKFHREAFIKYLDDKSYKNLTETDIQFGLTFLSAVLQKHFNKKVFVLIDELDAIIFDVILYHDLEVHKVVKFIRKLISLLLESNPNVERALINACTQLANVLTTNNVDHFPFLNNHKFVKFYGFTRREVESLLVKFKMSDKINDIESWYGYKLLGKDTKICRVWSVINYLQFNVLKNYWSETGYLKELKHIFFNKNIQALIEDVSKDKEVAVEKVKKIGVEQLLCLRTLTNSTLPSENILFGNNNKTVDLLFQFLCDIGYFNIIKVLGENMKITYLKLLIPNKEIKHELSNNIRMCNLINLLNT